MDQILADVTGFFFLPVDILNNVMNMKVSSLSLLLSYRC